MKLAKEEFIGRKLLLQNELEKQKIEYFIITQDESIYYLTGLTYKSLERFFFIVISPTKSTLIVPKLELAHLFDACGVDEIVSYFDYPAPVGKGWSDLLESCLGNAKRIAIERRTPVEIVEEIKTYNLIISDCLDQQRMIKSQAEISAIKNVAKYCELATKEICKNVFYGMPETDVYRIADIIKNKINEEIDVDYISSSFMTFVWPARIAHQPHGIPKTTDILESGTHISLAFYRINGYAAECERTFFTCPSTREQHAAFTTMLEARRQAFDLLREGAIASDIDKVVKNYIISKGYGNNILHRTGHGIGINNHERPFIAEGDDTVLKENMVISIEPGIYIDGIGGFRHSDSVLITKNGYELLTNYPISMVDLTFDSPHIPSSYL